MKNPLPDQASRESLAHTIAEIQNYLTCLGVSEKLSKDAPPSVLFRSLCKANDLPDKLSLFEDHQLHRLHEVLESKWKSLPLHVQNQRVIVNSYLVLLNLSWGHESILKWIKKQNTPYTELSYEQLKALSQSLERLYRKRFPAG